MMGFRVASDQKVIVADFSFSLDELKLLLLSIRATLELKWLTFTLGLSFQTYTHHLPIWNVFQLKLIHKSPLYREIFSVGNKQFLSICFRLLWERLSETIF